MIDPSAVWMFLGFFFAAYAVVGNDSVQTLGTFIASNIKRFKWYWLWIGASLVLIFTLVYGWNVNDGDISYGRLEKFDEITEYKWYHALAPFILILLTRFGIPVSTTFLVLSAFATAFVLEKMLIKSFMGYAVAAVSAYIIWMVLSRFLLEKPVKKEHAKFWRVAQWLTTGFLWFTWLSHDMANIAIFLPRQMSVDWLIFAIVTLVAGLGYIFWRKGGKIQNIVLEKTGTSYVRSATIIDFVYAVILFYFKEMNSIPMSTTWVFVGLLSGRELAIHRQNGKKNGKGSVKTVFPLIAKDFFKMMIGLAVSIAIVLAIHYVFN